MQRLGNWWFDAELARLQRGSESCHLDPKEVSVLVHLAEEAPNPVSMAALLDRSWPGVIVGDNAVHQVVAKLRRALGDSARNPIYIETLPRRGYRLMVPLVESDRSAEGGDGPAARNSLTPSWWLAGASTLLLIAAGLLVWLPKPSVSPASPLDLSLSLVPFSALGDDSIVATYADALTEELKTAVAGYQEIRTVSMPDSRTRAKAAHTSYLLGGSAQDLGGHIRVRVHLTRTDDHQTVWGKTFEDPVADALQGTADMATTVGRFVRLQLVQDQQCQSVRRASHTEEAAIAYCAALAERYRLIQGGDLDLQVELSRAEHAAALDPEIADAHRIVALNYIVQGFVGLMDWRQAADKARAALAAGLALAPDDPRLLTVRGMLLGQLEFDRPAAEASFRASLARDPLHPNAYFNHKELGIASLAEGNLTQALDHFRRALRLYDADADIYTLYAATLSIADQSREAIAAADAGLRLVDVGWARAHLLAIKALAYDALGERPPANQALDEGLASAGPEWAPIMAGALAWLGRKEEALQIIGALEALADPPIEPLAFAYAVLGDQRAFGLIHQGIDRHIAGIVNTLRLSPVYSQLRKDPRWNAVMAHLEAEEAIGSVAVVDRTYDG
jgi:DNA-binding winged helix-turn-helix (wHTH) protein/TolB-like protein/tetratricopeptide (TPR) repeat protein